MSNANNVTAEMVQSFSAANPSVALEIFQARIAAESDQERIAELELCREYFTNPGFRAWLQSKTA